MAVVTYFLSYNITKRLPIRPCKVNWARIYVNSNYIAYVVIPFFKVSSTITVFATNAYIY